MNSRHDAFISVRLATRNKNEEDNSNNASQLMVKSIMPFVGPNGLHLEKTFLEVERVLTASIIKFVTLNFYYFNNKEDQKCTSSRRLSKCIKPSSADR